jgi:hypothetical protein
MYWVAGSTAATLIANRFAPALLDRYLAKTGYQSQQTHQPPSQYRPDNLWQPAEHLPVSACLAALELPVVVIAFLAAIDYARDRDIVVGAEPAYQSDPDGHRSLAIADEDNAAWACPCCAPATGATASNS